MGSIEEVLTGYDSIRSGQEDFYRDLHRHPELSHQEERTAGRVAGQLRNFGYRVSTGIGGTGVTGVLENGAGPTVLLRADMDALPVREDTGAEYASIETAVDAEGDEVPVMHACGHDVHVSCLVGAAQLMADRPDQWNGTLIALFQPAEEVGDGARGMIGDGLLTRIPRPDVALGQHVLPGIAGTVQTRSGPFLTGADSMKVTVYGRGGHGAMPQNTVDPVILAAMVVVRLQTVVSRETDPTETAVLTVGSIQAGSKSNIVPDSAVIQLNMRTYSPKIRQRMQEAVRRIVLAECQASGSPRDPDFEVFDSFPVTDNDATVTAGVADAFTRHFGERAGRADQQTASEDFSDIPRAAGIPYTYWALGGTDPQTFRSALKAGHVQEDVPANHSPRFLPVMQPTLRTGTEALVVAALAWLTPSS